MLKAPLFADCTGDGTIGALAGADFSMGREAKSDFSEETAPLTVDKMTMGTSVLWHSAETKEPISLPKFNYGLEFNEATTQKVLQGQWYWETGMDLNQLDDFERIRDYMLLVIYSNWSFLKNEYRGKAKYAKRNLEWVAYIGGKRESRR